MEPQEAEDMGKYVVGIEGTYEGQLRVTSQHVPSKTQLSTDAPKDNHGKGESFSPTDLVATALGSCILTTIAIVGERRGLDLSGLRFRTEKEMVSEPERRIGSLETTIWLPDHLGDVERRVLERAAHTCPVHRSLRREVDAPITFIYENDEAA